MSKLNYTAKLAIITSSLSILISSAFANSIELKSEPGQIKKEHSSDACYAYVKYAIGMEDWTLFQDDYAQEVIFTNYKYEGDKSKSTFFAYVPHNYGPDSFKALYVMSVESSLSREAFTCKTTKLELLKEISQK